MEELKSKISAANTEFPCINFKTRLREDAVSGVAVVAEIKVMAPAFLAERPVLQSLLEYSTRNIECLCLCSVCKALCGLTWGSFISVPRPAKATLRPELSLASRA